MKIPLAFTRMIFVAALLVWIFSLAAARAAESPAPALLAGNMISNPSFEDDLHNNAAKGHVLAFMGDWAFNAADLKPDYWMPAGNWQWVEGDAHSGTHALLLKDNASAARAVIKASTTSKLGGGDQRWSTPGAQVINYEPAVRLARTVRASLWYKSADLSPATPLEIEIRSCNVSQSAQASAPAANWQRLEVVLTREEIEKAFADGKAKGVQAEIGVTVKLKGKGSVLIDDVSLAEDESTDPNLAVNGSFEEVDSDSGLPKGWSKPMKYRNYTNQYYKWTSWNHFFGPIRGAATTTDLMAHGGRRALLMQVYPGDEMLVEGAPVILNQKQPGIVEVGVYVMLDRLKWIDIRAVDQDGNSVPCCDAFTGGQAVPADVSQWYPSNAREWIYIRKTFWSDKPLQSIRPRLCARGFNGDTRDDSGSRPQVNQVGLAWWDDVRVSEVTATAAELQQRGIKLPKADSAKPEAVLVQSFDPGERLFGDNLATLALNNPTGSAQSVEVALSLLDEQGKPGPISKAQAKIAAGGSASVELPYHMGAAEMRGTWTQQGQMRLTVTDGKKKARELTLAYNTWPIVVHAEMGRHYALPNENPQTVAITLGVGRPTLARTKAVVLELRARRDDKVVSTLRIDDLAKALAETRANLATLVKPDFDTPNPVSWSDRKNLLAVKIDLSKLPIHPFDHPLRDHYLRVRGLDGSGNELFADSSEPFGRVQPNAEVLPAIAKTEIRQDGAVLINGQPTFLMAGNGYTTLHYGLNGQQIKLQGFNCVRWVENIDSAAGNWKANLYSLETMVHFPLMTEANLTKWKTEGKLAGVVTFSPYYESSSSGDDAKVREQHANYGKLAHTVANRLTNFGGGGAHNIYTLENAFDYYDTIGVELEPQGPPRGGLEMAPYLRKGSHTWFHLPQTYSNTPFDQFRFDQYLMIVQGGRGFSTIHGFSDPSFMRGITGEIRHLSPAIFSLDAGDPRTAVASDLWWMQRKVGKTTTLIALSKPAVEIGKWTWRDDPAAPDQRAHTGVSEFEPRPMPDGLRLHGFRESKPVMIEKGDRIIQSVWLDPAATPAAIAWGVRGDAKWDFNGHYGQAFDFTKWRGEFINFWLAGELLPGTWQISWQYNDTSKHWFADHILNAASFKLDKPLPAKGQWVTLEISADQAGLVGKQVDGFFFMAKDGQAWWAHSAIVRGGKEIVLCGKTIGPSRQELAAVPISVPWAPDGTKVKVAFEERELVVKNGAFTDDFRGVDTYQTIRGGALGDAAGWHPPGTALLTQTVGYVTPSAPTAVHIYEITPGP